MRNLMFTLALAAALPLSTPAFAGDSLAPNPSNLIAASGFGVFISVAVVGSVVAESAEAVAGAGAKLSDALRGRVNWTVAAVTPVGPQTRVALKEVGGTGRLEVMMPTERATALKLKSNDKMFVTPIGRGGFALRRGGDLVALVGNRGPAVNHSAARP